MGEVKVWQEKVVIPTYEIGEAEKNPIFLDKRVYQGSSGKVYPYPTVEKIIDTKVDKTYNAVFLENEYLKVMILPELGGRIQRAYDKTNGYDFVYYNHVIKPALVGLLGPWISGGIEFNWPQHHRPTTYMPVDNMIQHNSDGSCSVLCHDVDQMYGTKSITKFSLHPGKAYIEITGQLYNRTPLPQTFLWWANPAVPVNDDTQSIFPPDVHAVMDHGKRDVSRFPIATGVYYKKDYSAGVDISRYKNIPVPTSYMAEKSKYDFVGGYDYGKHAGILHVADHHISPGKKQWTWGCGDFGKAWDRNLTDADGPYVELMTGVYTDNQPDFTWLMPYEEKTFTQYFMPYKEVGQVKNATIDAAVNLTASDGQVEILAYVTAERHATVRLLQNGEPVFERTEELSPRIPFSAHIALDVSDETTLTVEVLEGDTLLVRYTPEVHKIEKLPEPAQAIGDPETIQTIEELYLAGQHIEQYRHATYLPDPYYMEALKRDPGDIRVNNAYGMLLLRRGDFTGAKAHFEKAICRLTCHNPNPYDSEAYYDLGLAQFYLGQYADAYDSFFKATWSNAQQEMSFYYLAAIDLREGRLTHALEMVDRALCKNTRNIKARALKVLILRRLDRAEEALAQAEANLQIDPFDFLSANERAIISGQASDADYTAQQMRGFAGNYLMTARDYAEAGAYEEALVLLDSGFADTLAAYYRAYYLSRLGRHEEAAQAVAEAERLSPDYCFPNKLEDIAVLRWAVEEHRAGMAAYYLGCLFYDKLQREEAIRLWEAAQEQYPEFPTVHRNLALAYYNTRHDSDAALEEMEAAFRLNSSDARVFLELDQLHKKLGWPFARRLEDHEAHQDVVAKRDDLFIEYITLLNMVGRYQDAHNAAMGRRFHTWEGGEGKITAQYTLSLFELGKQALRNGNPAKAEELLRQALVWPESLGEGKLEGTKDNHIYYTLGLALEAQGKVDEARQCYETATIGTDEPAGMMYYNDQPADMILYQGMAKKKLGCPAEAKARFYRLIDYGEKHLWDQVKIEYFAVSLPEFQIFDEDYTARNKAHCYYLMGLGQLGLGDAQKAGEFFRKALEIEPSHMQCTTYLADLTDWAQ